MNLTAVFLIVALLTPAPSQRARTIKVSDSNILEDLAQRKKQQPAITSRELAVYANELLEKRGFDYMFGVCDIVPKRHNKSTVTGVPVNHQLSLTTGEKRSFRFSVATDDSAGMCGECFL